MLRRSRFAPLAPLASLALSLLWQGCSAEPAGEPAPEPPKSIDDFLPYQPLTGWVDPFIGTSNGGNVVPGALVPHGVVKLSPDTDQPKSSIKGYVYEDSVIQGFSHTHLEGPGGSQYGYSQILVMPTRGEIKTSEAGYKSSFSHASERAEPGYYAVDLDGPNVRAELTASRLCGFHRYTFRGGEPGNVLFDLAHSRGSYQQGSVEITSDRALRGTARYQVYPLVSGLVSSLIDKPVEGEEPRTTGERVVHFTARFSRPFGASGTWQDTAVSPGSKQASEGRVGAFVTFDDAAEEPVELEVCLSAIDLDQAEKNLADEASGRTFDQAREAASEPWNKLLNRIQIKGGTDEQRRIFYTALFHAHFQPADYTESGRFWSGEDGHGAVLPAPDWRYYSDDWCMWDTFRTTHPLQMLLEPERRSDVLRSMLVAHERGSYLRKCSWAATGDARVMIAIPFVPIFADALAKGFDRFDTGEAWAALYKAATSDVEASLLKGVCGNYDQGTPPEYLAKGYVSHECDQNQSASMTLEYAYDDWALARVAEKLGKSAERDSLLALAASYKNVFNPEHGFAQGRHSDGSWVTPFDPAFRGDGSDFTEATSWVYSWSVPHDVRGLISLMGGPEAFVERLDRYFDEGHHDPGNEPGFHVPYLYLYAGAPSKTQRRVREVLAQAFSASPGGLPGNDDSGAMSAYYVLGAVGLYPITPGDDTLLIGSPLFDEATLYLEPNHYPGKAFVVRAENNGPTSPYVQSATLDGAPLDRPFITFGDVTRGGSLVLTMGPEPSSWGAAPENAPPSMTGP